MAETGQIKELQGLLQALDKLGVSKDEEIVTEVGQARVGAGGGANRYDVMAWLGQIGIEQARQEAVSTWLAQREDEGRLKFAEFIFSREELQRQDHFLNTPIRGRGQTRVLGVGAVSKRWAGDPHAWRRFATTALVATLDQAAREGESRETQVDILVHALRPAKQHLGADLLDLILAARVHLEAERVGADAGYYKTRVALADLLSDDATRPGRLLRATLYDEILRELRPRAGRLRMGKAWLELLEADGNNLAAVLDDLLLGEGLTDSAMRLSVSAAVAQHDAAGERSARLWPVFLKGCAPEEPDRHAVLIDQMMNVPSAWRRMVNVIFPESDPNEREWRGHVVSGLLAGLAAACRVALDIEDRKVAAALFNAGVDLKKAGDTGLKTNDVAMARVALNAAGLGWVLRPDAIADADDIETALHQANGIDCAVNLLGALTELASVDKAAIHRFATAMWAYRAGPEEDEYQRMAGSLRKLRVPLPDDWEGEAEARPDPRAALNHLMNTLLPEMAKPVWQAFVGNPNDETLAAWVVHAWHRVLGNDEYAAFLTGIAGQVQTLAQPPFELLAQWPDTPPDWAGDVLACLEGLRGAPPSLPERLRLLGKPHDRLCPNRPA